MKRSLALSLACVVVMAGLVRGEVLPSGSRAGYVGRLGDPNFFPIVVWLQNPTNAGRYRAAGINLFVGLWNGPTEEQLRLLKQAALLSDPNMLAAVTVINGRIRQLAPVLNSPTLSDGVVVASEDRDAPVAAVVKRHAGATYVFAAAMRGQATRAQFTVRGLPGTLPVAVLDEGRSLEAKDGVFADEFRPWDVHLYRIVAGG